MLVCNMNVKRGADGSKHLDVQLHGVIDGGWMDDVSSSSADIIAKLNENADAKTVGVRINSVGGDAFGGVAMYNALQAHAGEVTCTVEGLAASAASLVAMAGKTVMGRGAMMMIHPPSSVAMGNASEFRKTADFLDKVQNALASIYCAKTGKTLDEVNKLVNAETWMTADEAVAAGFADSIGDDAEPPGEMAGGSGTEPDGDAPQDRGAAVAWRGVEFPRASLPQQILAMAKPPAPVVPPVAAAVQAPVLALVPAVAQSPLTRAEIANRAPELLAALVEEGRAAGIAAERDRLRQIDELGARGVDELVTAAKYITPTDAGALAVAIVKAAKGAGQELLAARRSESAVVARIGSVAPERMNPSAADEARAIAGIVAGINGKRGGNTP